MKQLLLSVALLLATVTSLQALPAFRGIVKRTQPDGSVVHVRVLGDEHRHMLTTLDDLALVQDEQGWLRYAHIEQGRLVSAAAPAAHDAEMRSASEQQFVRQLAPCSLADLNINRLEEASAHYGAKRGAAADDVIKIGEFPTTGEIHALLILAEFSDVKFSTSTDYFERSMNEEGCTVSTDCGSARDYFLAQSGGTFSPTFDIVGPVQLPHQMAYYGGDNYNGDDARAEYMIRDACNKAKSTYGTDFSLYDYDNNGEVDMVFVIFAGYGENYGASTDCIWPHKYNLSNAGIDLTLDGKKVDTYACSCEIFGNTGYTPTGIGTFCHEFSHVLGLADHYNTNDGTAYHLGRYDVMEYGCYNDSTCTPANYSAFERYSLGWMDIEEIDDPQLGMSLAPLGDGGTAYRLQTPNANEFFLLENRQKSGWDSYLPGRGMMITHITYDRRSWGNNTVNNGTNPGYCLMPADNSYSYEDDAHDLFPYKINSRVTKDKFTDESSPSSLTWDGQAINRWVTNIKQQGDGTVTFNFMANSVGRPVALEATDLYREQFTAHWTPASLASHYSLYLYRLDTLLTRPIAISENFDAFTAGSYDNPDVTELENNLENYMQQEGWTGSRICQAGGMARLGGLNTSGSLTTPVLDLSRNEGWYTVIVKAQGASGKSPVFTVSAGDCSAKHRLSATQKEYLYLMHGGTTETQVTFSVNKERAFIDEIIIKRGDARSEHPDATIINVSPAVDIPSFDDMEADLDFTETLLFSIDQITDTCVVVGNLESDRTYLYAVTGWQGEAESELSNLVSVTLLSSMESGIETISNDHNPIEDRIYDLQGHQVNASALRPGQAYLRKGKVFILH